MYQYEYDPNHDQVSYNLWRCPECLCEFYGGGSTLHNAECTQKSSMNYDGFVFVFGPKQVEKVKEIGKTKPDQPWYGLTLNILRAVAPELAESE